MREPPSACQSGEEPRDPGPDRGWLQLSPVTELVPTLCNPMDSSPWSLPVVTDSRAGLERKKWPSWVPLFHTRPRHPVPTALAQTSLREAGAAGVPSPSPPFLLSAQKEGP